tara:strand:+ start:325 stop:549 length:225 start_codon:yes stop_codon:yes gene_type:complete
MNEARSKDEFKPCPKCLSPVDVVVVRRHDSKDPTSYFFVNCEGCGEGTPTAFCSMTKLQEVWNQYVEQNQGLPA